MSCIIDTEQKVLPADFGSVTSEVWMTPSCTVLRVLDQKPKMHGYVEIECTPRGVACLRTADSHRYFDWNGYRLLPFADEIYTPETH